MEGIGDSKEYIVSGIVGFYRDVDGKVFEEGGRDEGFGWAVDVGVRFKVVGWEVIIVGDKGYGRG